MLARDCDIKTSCSRTGREEELRPFRPQARIGIPSPRALLRGKAPVLCPGLSNCGPSGLSQSSPESTLGAQVVVRRRDAVTCCPSSLEVSKPRTRTLLVCRLPRNQLQKKIPNDGSKSRLHASFDAE